jgi:hypothetical protein
VSVPAITLEYRGGKVAAFTPPCERDDAAAESSTDHPCAERTGGGRELDEVIELRRRDLVVVAKRTMRRTQELTEGRVLVRPNGVDRSTHAGVLGHDVANAPIER